MDLLKLTAHRPYPPPQRPWLMMQSWRDLLFAHWRLPPAALRQILPRELPLDTFDGAAWLGVVPFRIRDARSRWLPPLPGVSDFLELNVRTYVTMGGKAGVYFFSLDASRLIPVLLARLAHIPYFPARMGIEPGADEWIRYRSARSLSESAQLVMRYRPTGSPGKAAPGSLTAWLTERYCMYVVHPSGKVRRIEIHHRPWPLQPAEAEFALNTMTLPLGLSLPAEPPLLHFARRQDMFGWSPEPAAQ